MYIESDGAKIHFEVDGQSDAPAVLLFGGAFCTLRMWDHVVPRLSESLRVVRFDLRGTGQSTPSADPEQYSFEQYARDAETILDCLGIERTHVWAMASAHGWASRSRLCDRSASTSSLFTTPASAPRT